MCRQFGKYDLREIKWRSPLNCRTLRDFLLWSDVKRLIAFFVLRGYALYSLVFVTNDINYYKTFEYLRLLYNYYNKELEFV